MAPTVAAVGPNDSVIWGISYDWGNYENDIEELTGIDTNAVNEDLEEAADFAGFLLESCLLYTSPSPRDQRGSRMPSSA